MSGVFETVRFVICAIAHTSVTVDVLIPTQILNLSFN